MDHMRSCSLLALTVALGACSQLKYQPPVGETFRLQVVGIPEDGSVFAFGSRGASHEWSSWGRMTYCNPTETDCTFEPDADSTLSEDSFVLVTSPAGPGEFNYKLIIPDRELGEVRCEPMASGDSFVCDARLLTP